MIVREILDTLAPSDHVIIRRGDEQLYNGYAASTVHEDTTKGLMMARVKKLTFYPEIRHKQYKEKGLLAPMNPEDTPAYEFKDLVLRLYYIIGI